MDIGKNDIGQPTVKIDGKTFAFQKWGAEDATDTLLDLIAVAGESAGSIASLILGMGADKDVGDKGLDGLFRQLTLGLTRNREVTKGLLKKLSGDRITCDGAQIVWANFYRDNLPLSFKVARANLEVQYGNFIDAVRSSGLLGQSGGEAATPAQ